MTQRKEVELSVCVHALIACTLISFKRGHCELPSPFCDWAKGQRSLIPVEWVFWQPWLAIRAMQQRFWLAHLVGWLVSFASLWCGCSLWLAAIVADGIGNVHSRYIGSRKRCQQGMHFECVAR